MATKKTTTKKSGRTKSRNAGGRPTKYQPAYSEQARKLALLGFTDSKMADFFGIAESTLNLWKKEHAEFSESLKAGKAEADAKVATALYQSALGGGTVTETREEVDADGNAVTKRTVKELPANVTAQVFWLKNRQPHQWRDKVVLEDETPPEELVETATRFEALMAEARARQRRVLVARGLVPPDLDEA